MNLDLQPPRRNSGDDNIIPMINIVFLLLIFFMVAGQIRSANSAAVELPASPVGTSAVEHDITVVMDRDNNLSINNTPVVLEKLNSTLVEALTGNDRIALLADKQVKAADLEPVLAVIRSQGIAKVSLFSTGVETP